MIVILQQFEQQRIALAGERTNWSTKLSKYKSRDLSKLKSFMLRQAQYCSENIFAAPDLQLSCRRCANDRFFILKLRNQIPRFIVVKSLGHCQT